MHRQAFNSSDNQLQDNADPYNHSDGGLVMQANTNVFETNVLELTTNWEIVRERAGEVFTKDRLVDALLIMANAALVGTISFSLYKAIQVSAYTGLGYAVFGHF